MYIMPENPRLMGFFCVCAPFFIIRKGLGKLVSCRENDKKELFFKGTKGSGSSKEVYNIVK